MMLQQMNSEVVTYGNADPFGRPFAPFEFGIRQGGAWLGNDSLDGGIYAVVFPVSADYFADLQFFLDFGKLHGGLAELVGLGGRR